MTAIDDRSRNLPANGETAQRGDEFQLMTTEQVHQLTGIAEGTLRAWRHRAEGPPSFRLGGVVVYRRTAVIAWIEQGEEAEQDRRGDKQRRKH